MTREEYDKLFKVTDSTTEGYSQTQLDWINDFMFQRMAEFSIDHEHIRDYAKHMFVMGDLALLYMERMRGQTAR